jgi:hypothetical protein
MVTIQNLILLPKALAYAFEQISLEQKIVLICALIWILSFVLKFLISPLICRFYILPKIEKKVGEKLDYSPILDLTPFGGFLNRDIEISNYILNRYYAYKKCGDYGLPFGLNKVGLKQVGYTIKMVSKSELIFSFFVRINLYVLGISFAVGVITSMLSKST